MRVYIAKLAVIFMAISVLFLSDSHAWNEPDSFMGIKFFTDLTKSIKQCRDKVVDGTTLRGMYDWKQGICWADKYSSYYTIEHTDLFSEVKAYMVDRKLAYLDCDLHWEMYPRTAAVFKERYGAPTRTQYENLTNALGAKIRNEILSWDGKQVSISIRQHTTSLDRSQATYETELWRQHSAKKGSDWVKKKAKGL